MVLLLLQIFLWQEQIEDYCKEEYYGYAVVGKDGTNNLGEDVEHACGLGEAKTYAERKTHDDHIALIGVQPKIPDKLLTKPSQLMAFPISVL